MLHQKPVAGIRKAWKNAVAVCIKTDQLNKPKTIAVIFVKYETQCKYSKQVNIKVVGWLKLISTQTDYVNITTNLVQFTDQMCEKTVWQNKNY